MADARVRTRVIGIVVAVVVAVLVAVGVRLAFTAFAGDSRADTIRKDVAELKKETDLPVKVDDYTTLEDVTAEDSAIRYHYTITGIDPSELSKAKLEKVVLPGLCSQKATTRLLDQDIHLKYDYRVKGTDARYLLDFAKGDCA